MTKDPKVVIPVDLQAPGAVECICEFCKLKFWILPSISSVAHDLPYCPEFELMDPIAFVKENNAIKLQRVNERDKISN